MCHSNRGDTQRLTRIGPNNVVKIQSSADLVQAAPVQNTWYTALDTKRNCRVIGWTLVVADTNETIQMRITIDGVVLEHSGAGFVADTEYNINLRSSITYDLINASSGGLGHAFLLEGRSVKIEFRKTTATGVGTISSKVYYGLF